MFSVNIADMVMQFSCTDTDFFERRFQEYRCEDAAEPAMAVRSVIKETVTVPPGVREEVVRENMRLVSYSDGRFCRYTLCLQTGEILQAIFFDPSYQEVEIHLSPNRARAPLSLTDYEYMLTGAAFSDRLALDGGLVMHGSALSYRGDGILFTANSGTGKSTHSGLWREVLGDAVTIVNDDKPALRFCGDTPHIYGTPWSGKTDLNHNVRAPLKAVVVLEQSPQNAIRRLSASETMYHLTAQTVRPYYDRENGVRALDAAVRLAETIPCYLLQCTISHEAVWLVHNTLYGKES